MCVWTHTSSCTNVPVPWFVYELYIFLPRVPGLLIKILKAGLLQNSHPKKPPWMPDILASSHWEAEDGQIRMSLLLALPCSPLLCVLQVFPCFVRVSQKPKAELFHYVPHGAMRAEGQHCLCCSAWCKVCAPGSSQEIASQVGHPGPKHQQQENNRTVRRQDMWFSASRWLSPHPGSVLTHMSQAP